MPRRNGLCKRRALSNRPVPRYCERMSKPTVPGDRIAKVLARRGVASRREIERMIEAGRISLNGKTLTSPAQNVVESDRIIVDGKPVREAEPPRVWRYNKPSGLVTTASDEKGRATVFDNLPEDLPRVMTVGRLDLTSEGLLLLTNDGEIKRKLELPKTGWLRKYRARLKGTPEDAVFDPLRRGITVDGERFQPMEITLDRQQTSNAWVTIGLREGKNREIRRAMESIGFFVNRLIRVSYGPFRLGELKPGEVEEIKSKVLRDQLGLDAIPETPDPQRTKGKRVERPRRNQKP
jgi:23S rRNA pseudouridine2605 synthase